MYTSVAHAFCIVAPTLEHAHTHKICNLDTYNQRLWCRTENFCHVVRHGCAGIWLATGADDAEVGKLFDHKQLLQETSTGDGERHHHHHHHHHHHGEGFLLSCLRVFEADCTIESDKLSLVAPFLGLYAEIFASHGKAAVSTSGEPLADASSAMVAEAFASLATSAAGAVASVAHPGAGDASSNAGDAPDDTRDMAADSLDTGGDKGGAASTDLQTVQFIMRELAHNKDEIFPPTFTMTIKDPHTGEEVRKQHTLFGAPECAHSGHWRGRTSVPQYASLGHCRLKRARRDEPPTQRGPHSLTAPAWWANAGELTNKIERFITENEHVRKELVSRRHAFHNKVSSVGDAVLLARRQERLRHWSHSSTLSSDNGASASSSERSVAKSLHANQVDVIMAQDEMSKDGITKVSTSLWSKVAVAETV